MEWYHGDCVGVENKKAAKKIEVWYCPICLGECGLVMFIVVLF